MAKDNIFNISVTMTPARTIFACIVMAIFLTGSALLYDASAVFERV